MSKISNKLTDMILKNNIYYETLFREKLIAKKSDNLTNTILTNVTTEIYYEKLFVIQPESAFHHLSPFRYLFIKTPLKQRIMYQSCREPKLNF